MNVSIFIPAYNAANHIEKVINRIPLQFRLHSNIYIINDGSSDSTALVIEDISKRYSNIKTIHFRQNEGYGAAVKYGLSMCRNDGCDYAACIHADGQYSPEFLEEFACFMHLYNIDLLQGSRMASGTALSGGMPLYKYIAGKCLNVLENMIFGLHLTDYHSGFLMYSQRLMQSVEFNSLSNSFDFDIQIIASAHTNKLKITERPIPTCYADEKSYLNPVTYGLRVLKTMFVYKVKNSKWRISA